MNDFVNPLSSEALLNILLSSQDATAIYTGEALFIQWVNQGMLTIWGKDKTVAGQRFEDALPEMKRQPFTELLKNVWRTGTDYEAKNTPADLVVDGKLQTFYFDFRYRAIKDEKGEMFCILHTATEVGDRMKAWELVQRREENEQQIQEELIAVNEEYQVTNEQLEQTLLAVKNLQNQLSQLVTTSPVGMTILKGPELVIEMANSHMLQIWGRTYEQVINKKLLTVFPELAGQPFPEMLQKVFNTGTPIALKEIAVSINDIAGHTNRIFVDFAYEPLWDIAGKITSVMATVSDITKIVEIRTELEANEKELHRLNDELEASNEEYRATNDELYVLNEEYTAINEELHRSNEELTSVKTQLEIANKRLIESNTILNSKNVALTEAESKTLALFEDAPVAIGILSGEELIINTANDELLKLWGKSPIILGQPLAAALPELDGQPFLRLLAEVMQTGKAYNGNDEKVFLERDGKLGTYYFSYVYKPLIGAGGKAHSIMVVAYEVTAQVETRKAIEEANERFQLALNAGKLGSYDLDLSTGKMLCSEQCKINFGLSPEDRFDFEDLINIILPEFREYVQQKVDAAIAQNHIYAAEYEIQCSDKSRRWIQATGLPRYDQEGKAVRIIGVTQDISERKAYEQRKDDFLGIASHELKTPITVLKANLQMLNRLQHKITDPMALTLISNATASMDKISKLIEDLLNINKHTQGKLELNKSFFDLAKLLKSCCNHIVLEGKYELQIDVPPSLPVFGDEQRIDQVLINFVNNAVKYAPESKTILLTAALQEYEIMVCVKDFGKGIPEHQMPHLFDRYWQANSSNEKYTGLGLGLFICSEIITRHGGRIGANSELGVGSTFWFTLPIIKS